MLVTRRSVQKTLAGLALLAATAIAGPLSSLLPEVERASLTVSVADLGSHLRTLASDEMEGRGLETRGNDRAAEYIADALARVAVPPAFLDQGDARGAYFQNFALFDASLGAAAIDIQNQAGTKIVHFTSGSDFYPSPLSADGLVSAPIALDEPQKGRILLVAAPAGEDPCASNDALEQVAAAVDKGAVGVVLTVTSLEPIDQVWRLDTAQSPTYHSGELADVPVACVTAEAGERLRKSSTGGTMTIDAPIERRPVPSRNVIGTIAGSDPARRGELVVIGAHIDHDGVDPKRGVMNGADDDGSGMAAVLEVAEAFATAAAANVRPARTIVFAFWNAEEKGLFGSRHFVSHPSPPGHPVANLNLDMVGRHEEVPDPSNPRFTGLPKTRAKDSANVLHLLGYSHSPDLTEAVREANARVRLDVRTSYDGGSHNLLRRSDQWSFLERGIPALFLTTGLHPDYHTPEDDVDKIDFDKLVRVARLTFEAAWRIADAPTPPRFVG
jgi:Peptidase family M28